MYAPYMVRRFVQVEENMVHVLFHAHLLPNSVRTENVNITVNLGVDGITPLFNAGSKSPLVQILNGWRVNNVKHLVSN